MKLKYKVLKSIEKHVNNMRQLGQKMKYLLTLIGILFFHSNRLYAQKNAAIDKDKIKIIREANPQYDNFRDLAFLKNVLQNKQIVWLGERGHGDGSSRVNQSRLIAYLHKELGFNVVILESDFFIVNYMDKLIRNGEPSRKVFSKQRFTEKISKSQINMIDLIQKSQQTQSPISIAGFDIMGFSEIDDSLKSEFKSEIAKSDPSTFASKDWEKLWEYLLRTKNLIDYDTNEVVRILRNYAVRFNVSNPYLSQLCRNELAFIGFAPILRDSKGKEFLYVPEMGMRDKHMAENLIWLLENRFKNQKVIVLSSTYHMLRNVKEIMTDKSKILERVPMNEYVHKLFGDKMYCIAFGFGGGYYGRYGMKGYEGKLKAYKGSVEKYLLNEDYNLCFVETKHLPKPCKLNVTFDEAELADWERLIDGFFFIKEMKPDHMIFMPSSD